MTSLFGEFKMRNLIVAAIVALFAMPAFAADTMSMKDCQDAMKACKDQSPDSACVKEVQSKAGCEKVKPAGQ
jgi:hypothetical protein